MALNIWRTAPSGESAPSGRVNAYAAKLVPATSAMTATANAASRAGERRRPSGIWTAG